MKRCEIRISNELHSRIVRLAANISNKTGETAPSLHSIFIEAIEEYLNKNEVGKSDNPLK